MAQYGFAAGFLTGTRIDIANQTPIRFGVLQDCQLDFSFTEKELHGQFAFPVAVARGGGKISGKAKFAQLNGLSFNNLFFGGTLATGQTNQATDEGPTAIPTTPFQVTATNGATFVADLGVKNNATGLPFQKVAAGPAAGQYSVSGAGVYTFASADNASGISVLITYTYTQAAGVWPAAVGSKIVNFVNPAMGTTPTFSVNWAIPFQGKTANIILNSCISSKLTLPSKNEDFVISELDFMAQADASNSLFTMSFAE